MRTLEISATELVVSLAERDRAAILDSCGVGHRGSHLLIAGVDPVETISLRGMTGTQTLERLEQCLERGLAAIFTISYDLGLGLQNIRSRHEVKVEQDIYVALFDALVVHDYTDQQTFVTGNINDRSIEQLLNGSERLERSGSSGSQNEPESNFSKDGYLYSIESIKEHIRRGDTYQTNLTQTLAVPLDVGDEPRDVFLRLRREHPAPFAAFIDRGDSHVISASPERFFKIEGDKITTSPIKGTRRRGRTESEDLSLRSDLLSSVKDRAENTMIVDLLRNDLGKICEYGSVVVEKLCDLEEHRTLFHLVSTVTGKLRHDEGIADCLAALFPCGSITGAPKIRTMQIIDQLEPNGRGLSMGAVGYFIPETGFEGVPAGFDLSVAIRTMVVRDRIATFNVGGGITIESDPEEEYAESLLKARALLIALGK